MGGPIIASGVMEPVLGKVNSAVQREVGSLRDLVGTNLAGIRHLADRLEEERGGDVYRLHHQTEGEKQEEKEERESNAKSSNGFIIFVLIIQNLYSIFFLLINRK